MTIEETKERIAVMQAYVDGKQIQWERSDDKWVDVSDPSWSINNNFRVKPEPKYRPFKDADECWQEMLEHQPFGWVKDKEGVTYTTITEVADGDDNTAINGVCDWCLAGIYENFTFADGTPFGILEEE